TQAMFVANWVRHCIHRLKLRQASTQGIPPALPWGLVAPGGLWLISSTSAGLHAGGSSGRSRNHNQKNSAQTSPGNPYSQNTGRQSSQAATSSAVRNGAMAPPARPPSVMTLLANARCEKGIHRLLTRAAIG